MSAPALGDGVCVHHSVGKCLLVFHPAATNPVAGIRSHVCLSISHAAATHEHPREGQQRAEGRASESSFDHCDNQEGFQGFRTATNHL